jgi:hypothetical protein
MSPARRGDRKEAVMVHVVARRRVGPIQVLGALTLLCIVLLMTTARSFGQAPDTTDPVARITSPAVDATVVGVVAVTIDASDDTGVAGVQLEVDGEPVGLEDTAAPWSILWDTDASGGGSHILTVVVRDIAGNAVRSEVVPVVVDLPIDSGPPPIVPHTVDAGVDELTSLGGEPVAFTGASLVVNDIDASGHPLFASFVATSSSAGGTIVDHGGDAYTYIPPAGFTGIDWFIYSVGDDFGGSATTIVTVVVTAPTPTVAVPNLVSLAQEDVAAALGPLGLAVGVVTETTSADVPVGHVIGSTPPAGTVVNTGTAIDLLVSLGLPQPEGCSAGPSAPTTLTGLVAGRTVTLQWAPPDSAPADAPTAYMVEGGLSPTGTFQSVPTGSAATSFVQVVPSDGTFYVRVRGVNDCGTGAPSNTVRVTVPSSGPQPPATTCSAAPGAPTNLATSQAGGRVTVTWTAPAGPAADAPTSYVLQAGFTPTSTVQSLNTGSAATTFSHAVPTSGTFYLRVLGVNACGKGAASTSVRLDVH